MDLEVWGIHNFWLTPHSCLGTVMHFDVRCLIKAPKPKPVPIWKYVSKLEMIIALIQILTAPTNFAGRLAWKLYV